MQSHVREKLIRLPPNTVGITLQPDPDGMAALVIRYLCPQRPTRRPHLRLVRDGPLPPAEPTPVARTER